MTIKRNLEDEESREYWKFIDETAAKVKARSMPKQNKHISKQDYETPFELIKAIEQKWDKFEIDLAASELNKKAPLYFTEKDDALSKDWSFSGLCWLNPPFKHIEPWAKKCSESTAPIIMLTPASVGSNWFAKYCHDKCKIYFIRPRITFVGAKDPFPKDCMLTVWNIEPPGYDIWKYK